MTTRAAPVWTPVGPDSERVPSTGAQPLWWMGGASAHPSQCAHGTTRVRHGGPSLAGSGALVARGCLAVLVRRGTAALPEPPEQLLKEPHDEADRHPEGKDFTEAEPQGVPPVPGQQTRPAAPGAGRKSGAVEATGTRWLCMPNTGLKCPRCR